MELNKSLEIFEKAPVRKAVLQNALPAMAAMMMVLIYNLADTFFIAQTHDALQVAAVSLATPVFLLFMAVGTIFGIGGVSVISRAMGEGKKRIRKESLFFLYVVLYRNWHHHVCIVFNFHGSNYRISWCQALILGEYAKTYLVIVSLSGPFCSDFKLLFECNSCRRTIWKSNDGTTNR